MRTLPTRLFEWVVIACVLAGVFLTHIGDVRFHRDESQWISYSRYLELALSGNTRSPEWRPFYATITQPPVARYVMGLGRMAGGYGTDALNAPWEFAWDDATNLARGRMPTPPLLWWSRLPMAVAAVLSGLLLVYCARVVAGRPAGYAMLCLFVITPYYALQLRRAMGESLLLLGILLVTIAGYRAVISWQSAMRRAAAPPQPRGFMLAGPLMWLMLIGIISGVTGATKLNGLALVGAGVGVCILLAWRSRARVAGRQASAFLAAGLLSMPLLTGAAFTAVNPYLYPDPAGRFQLMLTHRVDEIQGQQTRSPDDAIAMRDISRRLRIVPLSIIEHASPAENTGVSVLVGMLAIMGLSLLGWQAIRWWRDDAQSGVSVVLLLVAIVTVGPAVLTPLNWDRYYLPPVVFTSLCAAVAVAAVVSRIMTMAATPRAAATA